MQKTAQIIPVAGGLAQVAFLEDARLVRWVRTFEGMRAALGARPTTVHMTLVPPVAANDATPADALLEMLASVDD